MSKDWMKSLTNRTKGFFRRIQTSVKTKIQSVKDWFDDLKEKISLWIG